MTRSRRRVLQQIAGSTLGAAWLLGACSRGESVSQCAGDGELTSAEEGLRRSVNYVDRAPNQNARCEQCSFFKASSAGCGQCQILQGPVNARGHCNSWSRKT